MSSVSGGKARRGTGDRGVPIAGGLLVLAVALAFAPVLGNEFVNYDDDTLLFLNPRVRGGLTLPGVRWAFGNLEFHNWIPLTWLSHMADFQLFGDRAGAHHAVSLALHAANALVLFLLLRGLTGRLWPSALAAGLFALHPLRVESVAWASERKDVLSFLLWLATLAAWVRWLRRRAPGAYAAALGLYACALMAKPMAVILPAALLLLDLWPFDRWRPRRALPASPARLLLEKAPFLALAAATTVVTLLAQRGGGAVATAFELPLRHRIPNAVRSYGAYLGKTIWPTDLAVLYPLRWETVPWWEPALGAALVAALSAAAVFAVRRRPDLAVGWFWYLATLLPVIGLIQAGSQAMADRYTYIPHVGLFLALSWALAGALRRLPRLRPLALCGALALLGALGAGTWRQAHVWRTGETLFRHAIAVTHDNFIAYSNLGAALAAQGRHAEANAAIARSFQLNPAYRAEVLARSGDFYAGQGLAREAAQQYRKALELTPWDRFIQEKLRALGPAADAGPAPPVR